MLKNPAKHAIVQKAVDLRVRELVARLTPDQLFQLEDFAVWCLAKFGLRHLSSRDLLHDAILAVMLGLRGDHTGRHPRREDLANRENFARYIRGVMHSLGEARIRREHRYPHVPLDTAMMDIETASACTTSGSLPGEELAFRDFKDQLFSRLKARCPSRLGDILASWENEADSIVAIPLVGHHRRHRVELRRLAQKVLRELQECPEPVC